MKYEKIVFQSYFLLSRYLKTRQAEWAEAAAQALASIPDPDCPPGKKTNYKSKQIEIESAPKKLYKGTDKFIGFFPTNQNTLYLLRLSDNEIITVHGRPAICTLIGWFKRSCLYSSLSGFCGLLASVFF